MMPLLAEANAILQVVGLALVMNGNPGVDVVLPRVQSLHATPHTATARQAVTVKHQTHMMIDDHAAILAFPTYVLLSDPNPGWNVLPLKPVNDYSYVALDGEHLQLIVNGQNAVATVPNKLPRISHGCGGDSTARGSSRGRFPPPPLTAGYQPPHYSQAAAVLRIAAGSVDACTANVNGDKRGRVDTRVSLNNDGTVILKATKNGVSRQLTFDGDSLLILANVPKRWLDGNPYTALNDLGHFEAYYTMLDPNRRAGCRRQPPPDSLPSCGETALRPMGGKTETPVTLPEPLRFMTYDCSNSSYP